MKARIFSTVVLWLIVIVPLVVLKGHAGVVLIAILSALTQLELYQLFAKIGAKPHSKLGISLGTVTILLSYYTPFKSGPYNEFMGIPMLIITTLACALTLIRSKPDERTQLDSIAFTLLGYIMVPFSLQFLTALTQLTVNETQGLFLAVWVVAVAKFTDVGGLLVGKLIGKRKLSPYISPNKTWEGAIGGLIASAAIGIGLVVAFRANFPPNLSLLKAGLFSIPIASAGIVSDLIESYVKRLAGEKDSGAIIPGIGGIYDLSDSLLLSAPAAYLLFMFAL